MPIITNAIEQMSRDELVNLAKELAAKYEAITSTTMDAFWITDPEARIIDANDTCCSRYGFARDEIIGMGITDFEATESRDEVVIHTEDIKHKGYDRFVTQHRTRDGRVLDIEVSTSYEPAAGQFLAFTRDITEQKQLIDDLTRSERLLAKAQRIGIMGVYDFDIVADRWTSSPEMDLIFGINEQYTKTLASWGALIHPDERDNMLNYFKDIASAGTWFDMEYRIIRPSDGEERWLYGTGEFTKNESGRAVRMIGTIQDITERRLSELRLQENEELYRQFTTLTSDYVHYCTRSGDEPYKIKWLAGAIEEITGYAVDEILALGCWLPKLHPDDMKRFNESLMTLKPGDTEASDFRMIRKDGHIRWIHHVCRCEQGDIEGELKLYGSSSDITGRKQYEQNIKILNENLERLVTERTDDLNKINEELAGFSYSVSHELRAPIARLQGFSSVLIDEAPEGGELRFLAERIAYSSCQLQNVVDAILTLSRLTRAELNLTSVDLSGLVGRICASFMAEYPERNVEIVIEPGIVATADLAMMKICLENLIGNALKFTANIPAPRIEFGTVTEKLARVFFVRDNGAGFDMAFSDKLYEPFERLHQQNEFPGMGIGLATTQRIVERHGGRLWAEGSVGGGATFYFTL